LLSQKLGLTGRKKITPTYSLELVSIGKANAEMIEYQVSKSDSIVNKQIVDIHFPSSVLINAIIRGDQLLTPRGNTVLLEGDILYILTPRSSKVKLKEVIGTKKGELEAM